MTENIANFCIELDAIFNDGGLTQATQDFQSAGQEISSLMDSLQSRAKSGADVFTQSAFSGFSALKSGLEDFFNYTSSAFLDLDLLIKSVWDNMVNSFFEAVAKMAANAVISNIFGGMASTSSGFLGSRRRGGPIDKTGPYYLHEGEFVLPPEVVSAIKGGSTARTAENTAQNASAAQTVNITLNTPITLNGSADKNDAQKLCEEISRAARRGVSWAVEQAKISYKIGRERSTESAL